MTRVLVAQTDPTVRELIALHMRHEGYTCVETASGSDALGHITGAWYDLVILDFVLPDLGGVSICRAIRNASSTVNRAVPILMVATPKEEHDKVMALESGADDYLTRPFGPRELVARSRALLRRRLRPTTATRRAPAAAPAARPVALSNESMKIGAVDIDPARRRVLIEGRLVLLTDQEFRLIHHLAAHAGVVFSRDALVTVIWRGSHAVEARSIDSLVKRLRQRIEPAPANPRYILTARRAGYMFVRQP